MFAKKLIALGAVAALALAGCSSNNASSGTSASPGGDDHEATLKTYFDAFATDKSTTMEPMLTASAPGSAANLYAQHQINGAIAGESAGGSADPSTVTVSGEEVTMVRQLPNDATEQQKQDATNVYKDFTYSADGLIESWVSVPGGPLAPRISAQTGTATSAKETVALKTAYETNSGALIITMEVTNKNTKKVPVSITGYITPEGRQVQVALSPSQLGPAPGTFTTAMATASNAKRGGKLIVQFDYKNDVQIPVT